MQQQKVFDRDGIQCGLMAVPAADLLSVCMPKVFQENLQEQGPSLDRV
jgi:uncharacterized membrane protein